MRCCQLEEGRLYLALVSGRVRPVRLDLVRRVYCKPSGRGYRGGGDPWATKNVYDVTDPTTGRRYTFRSARRFRSPAALPAPGAAAGPAPPPPP